MADEVYKKTLNENEYNSVFNLVSSFKTEDPAARVGAASIVTKIQTAVQSGLKDEVVPAVLDEIGKVVTPETTRKILPTSLVIDFSRAELDSISLGLKHWIKDVEITADKIIFAKAITKILGISNRFSKFLESILESIEKFEEPLDPIVDEPLDAPATTETSAK